MTPRLGLVSPAHQALWLSLVVLISTQTSASSNELYLTVPVQVLIPYDSANPEGTPRYGIAKTSVPARACTKPRSPCFLQDAYTKNRPDVSSVVATTERAVEDQFEQGSDVMIFVHGFGESEAESIRHMADLEEETPSYAGQKLLFDWPTQSEVAYVADVNSALGARHELAHLLMALSHKGVRVSIVAHSMGSFVAVEAVSEAALMKPDLHLEYVVLAAADIDVQQFEEVGLPTLLRVSKRLRVYTNADDLTLTFSTCLNHASRAGIGDKSTSYSGARTDVTGLVPLAYFGHSYLFNSSSVATDLDGFLTNSKTAPDFSDFSWLGERESHIPTSVFRNRKLIRSGCRLATFL